MRGVQSVGICNHTAKCCLKKKKGSISKFCIKKVPCGYMRPFFIEHNSIFNIKHFPVVAARGEAIV